jgi:hypothetical protein
VLESAADRTLFLGMDQFRDELPQSSVKGKNPLKDVRVRQALYHAIDQAILRKPKGHDFIIDRGAPRMAVGRHMSVTGG